ncbi:class I SAM-dependent methyltransferase, partial [Acinetobacter baumannii]
GLDARAYRLRSLANATVFEVDHPDTQAYKLARVGDLASVARRLVHVPVDFAMQSFAAALREAGFDPRARSVFVWEGVVMYLERAAIDE